MIISTPDVDVVQGHAAQMYDSDLEADGLVFAHTRAMAVDPEAHEAFVALVGAIVPSIGLRAYELATLAAARAIGSTHCLLAHGRKALDAGVLDEEQLIRFAADPAAAGLDEADQAVVDVATRLSRDPAAMTEADSARLRAAGFTDRQILDVALAAGARNLFSRVLLALDVPLEPVPRLSAEVAEALLAAAWER